MYNISVDDDSRRITIDVAGDLKEIEFKEIINKLKNALDDNVRYNYTILINMEKYNFYFWQLPYIMKLNNVLTSINVYKTSIIINDKLSRSFGIKLGVQENKKQGVFLSIEEGEAFLQD